MFGLALVQIISFHRGHVIHNLFELIVGHVRALLHSEDLKFFVISMIHGFLGKIQSEHIPHYLFPVRKWEFLFIGFWEVRHVFSLPLHPGQIWLVGPKLVSRDLALRPHNVLPKILVMMCNCQNQEVRSLVLSCRSCIDGLSCHGVFVQYRHKLQVLFSIWDHIGCARLIGFESELVVTQ